LLRYVAQIVAVIHIDVVEEYQPGIVGNAGVNGIPHKGGPLLLPYLGAIFKPNGNINNFRPFYGLHHLSAIRKVGRE